VLSFPDWTFFFQIALFLCLWIFLRRFLFEPGFSVLKSREQRSAGALQEASKIKAEAEAIGEQYQARLIATRAEANQRVDSTYREAEAQAQSLIDSARADAAQTVVQMRANLQQEIETARRALEESAPEFSREIAQKLLGRSLT